MLQALVWGIRSAGAEILNSTEANNHLSVIGGCISYSFFVFSLLHHKMRILVMAAVT